MDIAELSMQSSQASLMNSVGDAMLKKTMDSAETTGANIVRMMEQSVNPNLGGSIDIKV